MEDFLKQMVAIEQSRVDREDKRVEKEAIARKQDKAQMAEQRETDKRMMAEQHDRFMQLLQEVQIPHERNPPPPPAPRLHIQKFCEETDDMAAYLNSFEATAMVSEWPIDLWSIHLRESLSGAGLMAASALSAVQQTDFQIVKQTLLSVYQISTETHRKKVFEQTFKASKPDQWLRDFKQNFHQWLDSTERPTRETVFMELVLAKLPNWLENQMRNLNSQSYEGLYEAIFHYIGNQKPRSEKFVKPLEKENYHASKDTPYRGPATELKRADTRNPGKPQPYSRDLKTVECFHCGKKGHMKKNWRVKMEQAKCGVQITKKHLPDWTKNVKINGQSVKALLDTGCTKSLVHPKCVQKKDYLGYQILYQTASNKRTYFPAASVTLELEGKKLRIAVGVSEHLAEDMLMGRDFPHFRQYLKKALDMKPGCDEMNTPPTTTTTETSLAVTRAQQQRKDELEEKEHRQQEQDGAVIMTFDPVGDGSEAEGSETKPVEDEEPVVNPTPVSDDLDNNISKVITPEELGKAQRYDPTLKFIREKVGKPNSPYFWENGLLMREPYNTLGKKLIVLPQSERTKALRMAHHGPIAGHFPRDRTLQAIRVQLDWPGIVKDVYKLCASCPICQKSGPAILSKAPLQPLPIIKDPFSRVAMDVFGPLTRTKVGNKYVLVLMDYTSKWPEAYALRNVTTETVIKCLIDMTARIGIPEEVLTDNGSNFVSKTMREYCTTMGIEQIKTSPYHPQTDGMVERFNATFKRLLRKLTKNPKVEWDECLPYVLWAYRGTVHQTTGFSPYQMLYGRPMRVPLDQMVRYWTGKEEQGQNTTIEFVETLRPTCK